MKKKHLILFIILNFIFINSVKANTINKIETNVYIDSQGNGHVTEKWDIDATSGTESYHSFENMDNYSIYDFMVTSEGNTYTYVDNWNVSATKNDKNKKNGINYTANGMELCWGIEYGRHKYTLKYKIKNLVWQYTDKQILYFTFLPQNMKQEVKSFNLMIYSNDMLNNVDFSSYGFKSKNYMKKGIIYFKSKGKVKTNEYAVALIAFPNNTFKSLSVTNNTNYKNILKEANRGAKLNREIPIEVFYIISKIIFRLLIFAGIIIFYIFLHKLESIGKEELKIKTDNYYIPKEIEIYREIPFNKDIIMAYYIGSMENIMKIEYMIGIVLLKWVKEKRINIVFDDKNDDSNTYIDFINIGEFNNKVEADLKNILTHISSNEKLYFEEFKAWIIENYRVIDIWMTLVIEESKKRLIDNGYIIKENEETYELTKKLAEEVIKLKGLKKYLENIGQMDEKMVQEIQLWDDYIIFAMSFGIADKIENQLEKFTHEKLPEVTYKNIIRLSANISLSLQNEKYRYSTRTSSTYDNYNNRPSNSYSRGSSYSGGGKSSGGFSSGGGGIR